MDPKEKHELRKFVYQKAKFNIKIYGEEKWPSLSATLTLKQSRPGGSFISNVVCETAIPQALPAAFSHSVPRGIVDEQGNVETLGLAY